MNMQNDYYIDSKYPVRRCLDTQNPLQNHLQKGLKHKRDIREYQQNHTNKSEKKEELQPFAQKILPKGKELTFSPHPPVQAVLPITPPKTNGWNLFKKAPCKRKNIYPTTNLWVPS